ncbi:hypothetical protein SCLCIDRAFT_1219849 [Scleroderma citrinum Foug A]|uniref:Uncharacterized protein n=1 Tax=Scleroderma citrinum Foug A TaxID=1036808 RepID=A0A0C3D8C6_9AGAM|nr:hypothetical protein SCLCIDRAFT_1219849 [Scleroderma citrinum Foug A]
MASYGMNDSLFGQSDHRYWPASPIEMDASQPDRIGGTSITRGLPIGPSDVHNTSFQCSDDLITFLVPPLSTRHCRAPHQNRVQSLQYDSELPHDAMVRVQGDMVANDCGVSKIQHPVPARSRRSAHMSRRRIIVSCILPCASQPSMPAAASRLTLVVRSRYDVRVVPKALLAFCVMCFLMRPNQRQRTRGVWRPSQRLLHQPTASRINHPPEAWQESK